MCAPGVALFLFLSYIARGFLLSKLYAARSIVRAAPALTLGYRPTGEGFPTWDVLKKDQPTIGMGVVWWFGQKQGGW